MVAPEKGEAREALTVGLIIDPGLPADVAFWLSQELPPLLSKTLTDRWLWRIEVVVDRLVADEQGRVQLSAISRAYRAMDKFDLIVCLTDHPRRSTLIPVVGDVNVSNGVALAALPALGAVRMRARARSLIVALLAEMIRPRLDRTTETVRKADLITARLRPFQRIEAPEEPDIEIRFVGWGPRSRLRLLTGMVRANRPWRLVPSLSGAFATALGAGGIVAIDATVWAVAVSLGPLRLAASSVLAVAAMSAWLMADHHMWEKPSAAVRGELTRLYNAATVLTVALGVVCLYLGLLVLGWVVQLLLLRQSVLDDALRSPTGLWQRFEITWLVASVATVGGALGTGFESDDAVLQAAYGFRQRQRRRQQLMEQSLIEQLDREVADDG